MPITRFEVDELEALLFLSQRVLADYRDPRRGPLQMLYIFANTTDNADSTFVRAVDMEQSGAMKNLGLAEGTLGHGHAGFSASLKRLRQLGWSDSVPVRALDVDGVVNTLREAEELHDYSIYHRGDIGIVAPPFHLVRAFVSVVSTIAAHPMRVYAYPGVPLPWSEEVVHSQGVVRGTRSNLLKSELERLAKYRASEFGGLLSAREVLQYLDWRDT